MNFDDKLREMISQAEVPDELKPENIAIMLKTKAVQSGNTSHNKNIITMSSVVKKKIIMARAAAACAACVALAIGIWAVSDNDNNPVIIDGPVDYEAVTPANYDDLYSIYTGIYLEDSGRETPDPDVKKPGITDGSATGGKEITTSVKPIETVAPVTEEIISSSDEITVDGASKADIVKSDGSYLYYITESKVCIVSLESMEVLSQIEKADVKPFEMYIEGNKLILLSKETQKAVYKADEPENFSTAADDKASDSTKAESVPAEDASSTTQSPDISSENSNSDIISGTETSAASTETDLNAAYSDNSGAVDRTNIVVEEFDISSKENPQLITVYKQNGEYTSSHMADGVLYLVTGYSDYRTKPLEKEADLDNFVPAYYINNEKYYVAAGDITVPANPNTTDYTVISRMDCKAKAIVPSVKAVLGMSRKVYCSADTLYVVGTDKGDKNKSTITSFDLDNGGIGYAATTLIDGNVTAWMSQYKGNLRIVVKTADENGIPAVKICVLDGNLEPVNQSDYLLVGQILSGVSFNENYVGLMINGDSTPAIVLDLNGNPPVQVQSLESTPTSVISAYGEDKLLTLGAEYDENGKQTGLCLSMFEAESGLKLQNTVISAGSGDLMSSALTDRRAMLVDYERGIVAVPVYSHNEFGTKNQYYIYSYDDSVGFSVKGVIEYNDIDDSYIFERAVIVDDVFYAIAKGRIVSAQVTDFKVIDSFTF